MKISMRFWSNLIVCFPVIILSMITNYLPNKVPVYVGSNELVDRYITKQEWISHAFDLFILFVIARTFILFALVKHESLSRILFIRIQLLSAILISLVLVLHISEGLLITPLLAAYLPTILSGFVSVCVYYLVPKQTSIMQKKYFASATKKQLISLQYISELSRIVIIRINVVAGVLMLFVEVTNRWFVGVLANLLAFAALRLLAYIQLRKIHS